MAHLDGVAVDDGPVLLEVLWGEAALVDDLHLLHDGALPRLTRTWDQKFYNPLIFFLTKKSRNSLSVKEAMIGTGVWGWRKNREKQRKNKDRTSYCRNEGMRWGNKEDGWLPTLILNFPSFS